MRSEKELWELVLSRTDLFDIGLCHWVARAHSTHIINAWENRLLCRSLSSHLPEKNPGEMFCWRPFRIEPRIEWIKNRIKQLEDENKS